MPHTKVLFRAEAREKVMRGAATLADAIRVTLGPRSRSVLLERRWGQPLVCNDGVTIAKAVDLPDPEEGLGAAMMREAAERTGDAVGDGTSTSAVLAYAIFAEGLRNVAAGASAIDMKRGLDRGLAAAVEGIRAISRTISTRQEMEQVATIAAHNDVSIGSVVAEAVGKVGGEGVITVEDAKGTDTTLDTVEGMRFDRGWLSPYFVTDPARMESELHDPMILLHDRRIAATKDMIPALELAAREGRALLLVAEDVDADALATLVVNKMRGTLLCCAVKAPGYGDSRREMLRDMAVLTGGRVASAELGIELAKVEAPDLGTARRVVVTRDATTIVGGGGAKDAIAARVDEIRRQIGESKSDYDREKLRERLARLVGGVAVVRVGGPTEPEMKSRKEAFEDSIAATRAAVAEGVVPGGGLALLRAIDRVAAEEAKADGDERTGLRILMRALEAPARQIAENSGLDGGVAVERMRTGTGALGLDAGRRRWVDLVAEGIVDPTKVVRIALENAVSVASVLLLTEATITEIREPKPAAAPPDV